ncbi:MAG: tetratricopeptide repeat protein [Xanthomonadaceae bacterium]|nr:tetratricopeptide repeat protein [Xanthomonadaceae bacterium]
MQIAPRLIQALALFLLLAFGAGDALAQRNKKEENEFPNATRSEPRTLKISESNSKKINDAYAFLDEGEDAKAREILQGILDNARSSPYEKALCLQGLSQILYNEDDIAGAIEANEKALALDSLDNKSHFNLVYQVAQMNLMDERYDGALAAIDRWTALTGNETAEALALKGNALYRLERYPEASAAMQKAIDMSPDPSDTWQQILVASYYDAENFPEAAKAAEAILAKDPSKKTVARQLASIYIEMEQGDKAIAVLEGAKSRGLLTDAADLRQLFQLYNYVEKPAEAARTINEGLAAGILKEDFDTLKGLGDSWVLTAQLAADESAQQKEAFDKAIEAYGRASPLAKDGEMDFVRAQLLIQEKERFADGKAAMNQALSRGGLKREGEAYILLGNAEAELGNQKAAIAAYEKARSFPNTKSMAESWLRSTRGG